MAARRDAGYTNFVTPRALTALLEHLRGLGVVPPTGDLVLSEAEELLGRYRAWLCSERGLAAVTARNYADMVRPFLSERADAAGELDLRELAARDVLAFVLAECPHRRSGSAKLLVTALRSLLGYLHVAAVIARPLAPNQSFSVIRLPDVRPPTGIVPAGGRSRVAGASDAPASGPAVLQVGRPDSKTLLPRSGLSSHFATFLPISRLS